MFNLEARLLIVERLLQKAIRDIADLFSRTGSREQQVWTSTGGQGGAGQAGAGAFKCVSAAGTVAGGLSTETIYQLNGGTWTSIGSATIYNPMPADALLTGHTVVLVAVGDGTYCAVSQSCT